MEKPILLTKPIVKNSSRPTNETQVFAAMFNQRTNPQYRKIREMIQDGTLGLYADLVGQLRTGSDRSPASTAVAGEQPGAAKVAVCCSIKALTSLIYCSGCSVCRLAFMLFGVR